MTRSTPGVISSLENARLAAQTNRRAEAAKDLRIADAARCPDRGRCSSSGPACWPASASTARRPGCCLRRCDRRKNDVELTMLAARNAWWSEQPVLSRFAHRRRIRSRPSRASRRAASARRSAPPRSRRCPLRDSGRLPGGARENLLLARALVNEGDFASALPAFNRALDDRALATDSLLLEAASAAAAADSVNALERLTNRYREMRPEDTEATLRLARAFAWRGVYDRAIDYYNSVPAATPGLHLEVGQVLMWSGKEAQARRRLELALNQDPSDATTLKLLGDLSSWRGDWSLAHRVLHAGAGQPAGNARPRWSPGRRHREPPAASCRRRWSRTARRADWTARRSN